MLASRARTRAVPRLGMCIRKTRSTILHGSIKQGIMDVMYPMNDREGQVAYVPGGMVHYGQIGPADVEAVDVFWPVRPDYVAKVEGRQRGRGGEVTGRIRAAAPEGAGEHLRLVFPSRMAVEEAAHHGNQICPGF